MITSPYIGRNQEGPDTALGTILFWANQGAMHQGLVQAMRSYLPGHRVTLVEQLPDPMSIASEVSLVLLDLGPDADCQAAVAMCRQQFPGSPLGLVMRAVDREFSGSDLLFERREIQGLLPLELKLDVWLAALSLLVQGGEYYPPAFSRRVHRADEPQAQDAISADRIVQPAPVPAGQTIHLTPRERQVLELLSEGYQNKLIANRMALSEHTVKVHVHNLITKMHVTNRTQAAAAFRSGRLAPTGSLRERRSFQPVQVEGRL